MTSPPRVVPIIGAVVPVPVRARRNWSEEDAEKAREMGDRVPEYLYRYVKIRDDVAEASPRHRGRLETTVCDSTLHFANYESLNDPFEGSFSLSFDADAETKRAYWTEVAQEQGWAPAQTEAMIQNVLNATPEKERELEAIVKRRFLEHGTCCFFGREDDLLAWSYYAGGHTGLCLRFRMKTLFETLGRAPGMLLEVQYQTDYPRERFYQSGQFNIMLAAFCTKSENWKHEGEWRLVLPRLGLVRFPPEALDGIIMGCGINPDDEQFVGGLINGKTPPIQLLRASKKQGEYALQIVGT